MPGRPLPVDKPGTVHGVDHLKSSQIYFRDYERLHTDACVEFDGSEHQRQEEGRALTSSKLNTEDRAR